MAYNFISNDGEIDQSDEVLQVLRNMCENDEHADVILIVGGMKIPALKNILSARSTYFKSLFGGGFAEAKQAEIELKVPLNAFKAILKYVYTGCLSLDAFEWNTIIEIYDLANQYGFDALKKIILDYLTPKLTLENCIEILNAAQLYSMDELQNSCIQFMDFHSTELLGHDTFKELPISSLCAVLKRDSFYAPEVEIFKAICKWYKSNPDADIKEALSAVRWSDLSSKDMFDVVLQSKILDREELLKLIEENLNGATSRIPNKMKDTEINVASTGFGAKVISGGNSSTILGCILSYQTCAFSTMESEDVYYDSNGNRLISPSIIVSLGRVKFINYIQFLLFDLDARSYSYYVEVSLDGETFERLFDHTEQLHRSWQYLHFESRPILFIKLVGTRAIDIDISNYKRFGYSNGIHGEYDSFDIVNLKAMYKTTNIPKQIDGVIVPSKNVATVECGAIVREGIGGNDMLNLKIDEFTCHEKSSYILLQLNQPYVIGSLRMLLGNSLNHSNKYSFYIASSLNKNEWEMVVDKREEALTGWQEFEFIPRPAAFIKITGTQKDIKFICTYLECPRNLQKPKLKRPHP